MSLVVFHDIKACIPTVVETCTSSLYIMIDVYAHFMNSLQNYARPIFINLWNNSSTLLSSINRNVEYPWKYSFLLLLAISILTFWNYRRKAMRRREEEKEKETLRRFLKYAHKTNRGWRRKNGTEVERNRHHMVTRSQKREGEN